MLGGALMIRPEPSFAGRSPDAYHEEGPSPKKNSYSKRGKLGGVLMIHHKNPDDSS